jgi:RHS repeat-associated protein
MATYYYDGKNRQIARNLNGTIRFNVWDGWELIEEWANAATRSAAYLQGATGVIKSLTNNIYYYQDKLGSTTHIANASGALLEGYRYDLYGAPTYYDANGQPKPTQASGYGVVDLYAGERWVSGLGLYDLRNRFMSPELGRFLQPDPIGFKGDASNLYRYCGNDSVNKSDPMGLYGRASKEWTDREWQKYNTNQERAIKLAQNAKDAIDQARQEPEDKNSKSTIKGFEKAFGLASKENMRKVSDDLAKKLAALRDDGRKGYWAHPTTDKKLSAMGMDPNKVPAYTHIGDKNIWVNVGHNAWSNNVITWAIDHEAGHSAAWLRDVAYKAHPNSYHSMSNGQRLMNADSATDFVHQVGQ